jgi:N-acetylmuramic acid 6-phosphate etherase
LFCAARYAVPMATASSLPPDRGHVRTEHRHERSTELDELDTRSFVELMAEDHRAVTAAVLNAADSLAGFIDVLVRRIRTGGRLVYIGAGTSGRLGVLDASECPPTFQSDPSQVVGLIAGGDASLRRSSEGKEDDPNGAMEDLSRLALTGNDSVLGIAAGGTTPYVLGAIRSAKAMHAITGLLTCAPQRTGVIDCDHLIVLDTGPELLTGSTRLKGGSATKLALNIISTGVFIGLGKVYSNLMVDLRATNNKLADRAIRILIELCSELSREEAAALLTEAGGSLKAAIVMQRLDVDAPMAIRMLEGQQGRLRSVLGGA